MYWYHDEVKNIEERTVLPKTDQLKRIVFYGSSSIRLWTTLKNDFPDVETINVAFGGSTLAACCWFFHRIVPPQKPDALVLYAGDNDLGDGRHPEEVFLYFKNIMELVQKHCGNIPVAFMSIKPSLSRIYLADSIVCANKLIKFEIETKYPHCSFISVYSEMLEDGIPCPKLFLDDGLHLNEAGYALWKEILGNQFISRFKS